MNTNKKNSKTAPRVDMPCQPPDRRRTNFEEVALGYTQEMSMREAARCLRCKKPLCFTGCPVEVPIREFIGHLANGDTAAAYAIIKSANSLPAVCGRVCPQENQCEGKCVLKAKGRPVAIGHLERFAADACLSTAPEPRPAKTGGKKVACIGAGPASLTCAGICANAGLETDVFEALHEPGGVLVYGIPAFRLPKTVVAAEIDGLRRAGVRFHLNYVGGATVTIEELRKSHDAVFIGAGAGLPNFANVPGENLLGVCSANEYLTRANLGHAHDFPNHDTPIWPGKHVTVFGAGNVAMDAARTALRMGAESVRVVYRRTRDEMPARHEEIEHAEEEGVRFTLLSAPLRFDGDDDFRLVSVTLQAMKLGEPDSSGRRASVPVSGKTSVLPTDLAIIALGTRANPLLLAATPDLTLTRRGYIKINEETGETSLPNVFAGGDIVTGAATVILAMGAGRLAGQEIRARFAR
ncbi:MAG: ferredoxin-NADP(+) reductase subunit alpha [Candidatus Desulfovibrio kirbyi]|uniref:Ferredoxin-NADP(+) reductase subunit alpha n=1 Tax=Candidatus Desulfovibrio kirbyi TaxID=2696086 RepID=A0A6L2R707_9BACT|nr:MAG: ferredoxin-NADP(+) reductase subunit alpha [Candidatus Desulfovibrio kirbyi]